MAGTEWDERRRQRTRKRWRKRCGEREQVRGKAVRGKRLAADTRKPGSRLQCFRSRGWEYDFSAPQRSKRLEIWRPPGKRLYMGH